MPPDKQLPTGSFAVLGMVSMTPQSGYELAQAVQRSIAYFWPMSKTQVYNELSRLEGLGLVEGSAVAQERLPDKRVYTLTEAGERRLDGWLVDDETEGPTFRIPSLLKIFFGHRMRREDLLELLDYIERDCREDGEMLERIGQVLEAIPMAVHPWATAVLGQRMSEAMRDWAAEVRERLAAFDEQDAHAEQKDPDLFRDLMGQAPPFKGWRSIDRA